MEKQKAIEVLSDFFKCKPEPASIARELGVTASSVYQWPNPLTKTILSHIAGRLVGRRLPKELVEAIKGAK